MSTDAARPNSSSTVDEDKSHRCSKCGVEFKRNQSKTMPFCSVRCQQIDLKNWLDESYGFPFESEREPDYDDVHDTGEDILD